MFPLDDFYYLKNTTFLLLGFIEMHNMYQKKNNKIYHPLRV